MGTSRFVSGPEDMIIIPPPEEKSLMIVPSNGTAPFEIPVVPVNGYKVTWWRIENINHDVMVYECHAIYHAYKEYSGGRPIKNQWTVHDLEDGRTCEGWAEAWDAVEWRLDRCFRTRQEAIEEAIRILRKNLEDFTDQSRSCIRNIERLLSQSRKP